MKYVLNDFYSLYGCMGEKCTYVFVYISIYFHICIFVYTCACNQEISVWGRLSLYLKYTYYNANFTWKEYYIHTQNSL